MVASNTTGGAVLEIVVHMRCANKFSLDIASFDLSAPVYCVDGNWFDPSNGTYYFMDTFNITSHSTQIVEFNPPSVYASLDLIAHIFITEQNP